MSLNYGLGTGRFTRKSLDSMTSGSRFLLGMGIGALVVGVILLLKKVLG